MGCQTEIAAAIQQAGADDVLGVKDNQEGLRADSERVFDRCREHGARPGATDVDGGHGRAETRRCWVREVGGRGLIDSDRWTGVHSIALIEVERFEVDPSAESGAEAGSAGGETTIEQRYVLSSLPPDAIQLLEATRRHWQIGNGLHWGLLIREWVLKDDSDYLPTTAPTERNREFTYLCTDQ